MHSATRPTRTSPVLTGDAIVFDLHVVVKSYSLAVFVVGALLYDDEAVGPSVATREFGRRLLGFRLSRDSTIVGREMAVVMVISPAIKCALDLRDE